MAKYIEAEYKDGDYAGFKFVHPEFESTAESVERYGEALILGLINQQVASRVRAKVKNGLPKNLGADDLRIHIERLRQQKPDGILFTQQDADNWRPDQRALTADRLFKMAKEAFKKGDMDTGSAYLEQMEEMMTS